MLTLVFVGGSEDKQARIADEIQTLSQHVAQFNVCCLPLHERPEVLKKTINLRGGHCKTLLILSIKTAKEAEPLRAAGATFCIVEGVPSNEIATKVGDLYVTDAKQGRGLYLNPAQLYSQALLNYKKEIA